MAQYVAILRPEFQSLKLRDSAFRWSSRPKNECEHELRTVTLPPGESGNQARTAPLPGRDCVRPSRQRESDKNKDSSVSAKQNREDRCSQAGAWKQDAELQLIASATLGAWRCRVEIMS